MFLLQLRSELWKLFGKKRTYIGFGMFLLAQVIIILVYRYTHVTEHMMRTLERFGFNANEYVSILTISTIMVVVMAYTMMPLYVTLVGGDMVAKEAEDGTLRMILSRPVSRIRLLLLKWVAGAIFSMVLVLALGLLGYSFTAIWFHSGKLFAVPPLLPFGTFEPGRGLECYVLALVCMFPKAITMMGFAFMFSCFNMKPAAATILALSLMFIGGILQDLPYFDDYRTWFITYDMNIWREVFSEKIPWAKILESFAILSAYNLSFIVIGFTGFQLRDIKS